MSDTVETQSPVLSGQIPQHFFTAGMLLVEYREIVDAPVYHYPQRLDVVVTGDLLGRVDRVDLAHGEAGEKERSVTAGDDLFSREFRHGACSVTLRVLLIRMETFTIVAASGAL